MEARRITRSYSAPVSGSAQALAALGRRGTWVHQLAPVKGARTQVVRSGGQRAVTHYELLQRRGERALLGLELETGRKHQIRAQLAELGLPVVGDQLYEGEPAPRLMLHCRSLELSALGKRFEVETPSCFDEWFQTGTLCLGPNLGELVEDAGSLRWSLEGRTQAFRLVNGEADLLPGVAVDLYDDWAVLAVSSEQAYESRHALARALMDAGCRGVYLKTRVRADLRRAPADELAPGEPIAGEPAPERLAVNEGPLRYWVSLSEGHQTGLFVDQRENRVRVMTASRGKSVLNLFAYTCSFSVAAACGGAREVVSVDTSKRALEQGRENFELNGLQATSQRFVKEDAFKYLARAARRAERFDLVVLDPPTFSTKKRGTFAVASGYTDLVKAALRVLDRAGSMLCVTNHRKTSPGKLRAMVREAAEAEGREIVVLRTLSSASDCPPGPQGPEPSKSVWVEVK
jgi:23S rRNA (cytosine1962-C5)-methyltransferase